MRPLRRSLWMAGTLTILCGITMGVAPARATVPGLNGLIAFSSLRGPDSGDVYTMNPDGSNQQLFPKAPCGKNYEPAWSPDGSMLAMTADLGTCGPNGFNLEVLDQSGNRVHWLTRNNTYAFNNGTAAWSPDGTQMAFTRQGTSGRPEIWVMDAATGANKRELTADTADNYHPTWSPDGTKIAFDSDRDGNVEVYVMNADGTDQTDLTNNPAADGDFSDGGTGPSWSPNARWIAFESARDGNFDIFVMRADGSQVTQLTTDGASDTSPAWSPDGTEIAFTSYRTGGGDIYVMNRNGTSQIQLTTDPAWDGQPDWQTLP